MAALEKRLDDVEEYKDAVAARQRIVEALAEGRSRGTCCNTHDGRDDADLDRRKVSTMPSKHILKGQIPTISRHGAACQTQQVAHA